MKPFKLGQVAKFHTPLPYEDPEQLYVVIEINDEKDNSRALIKALNTGLRFPPLNTVFLYDLEIVEIDITDLFGHKVTINKPDNTEVTGKVVKINGQRIVPDITKGIKGLETNVWLTIQDESGKEHTGTFLIS